MAIGLYKNIAIHRNKLLLLQHLQLPALVYFLHLSDTNPLAMVHCRQYPISPAQSPSMASLLELHPGSSNGTVYLLTDDRQYEHGYWDLSGKTGLS